MQTTLKDFKEISCKGLREYNYSIEFDYNKLFDSIFGGKKTWKKILNLYCEKITLTKVATNETIFTKIFRRFKFTRKLFNIEEYKGRLEVVFKLPSEEADIPVALMSTIITEKTFNKAYVNVHEENGNSNLRITCKLADKLPEWFIKLETLSNDSVTIHVVYDLKDIDF